GPARHPIDPDRSPGGSSGGSAVSVADGMCFASLGTDTGGSIRIPAAACGLVGLKPTVGGLPTMGGVSLSQTLDHVGPMCRSVEDAGILYDVLTGSARRTLTPRDPGGIRLGIPRDYFLSVLDAHVSAAFEDACRRLREDGVSFEDVSIPH